MSNPWDNDPIVQAAPAQGAGQAAPAAPMPWDNDPIDVPAPGSRGAPKTWKDTASDIALSAVSGVDKGFAGIAGLPADAARGIAGVYDWADKKISGNTDEQAAAKQAGFFAPTAEGVETQGRQVFDQVAPRGATPGAVGQDVQDAARAGIAQTPEGQALADARWAAGSRVTPDQAGQVIQPELRGVYDQREGVRAAIGEKDYRAARASDSRVRSAC